MEAAKLVVYAAVCDANSAAEVRLRLSCCFADTAVEHRVLLADILLELLGIVKYTVFLSETG